MSDEAVYWKSKDMSTRPDWDEYFMQIAVDVSTRATCLRRHVGSVIVRDKRILTTGYNGSPRGLAHCQEVGCHMVNGHCLRCLHAEQNAIIQGALFGVSTQGATLYCTAQPCSMCAKMIVNAGIVKVVIGGDYPDEFALEVLTAAEIDLQYRPLSEILKSRHVPVLPGQPLDGAASLHSDEGSAMRPEAAVGAAAE